MMVLKAVFWEHVLNLLSTLDECPHYMYDVSAPSINCESIPPSSLRQFVMVIWAPLPKASYKQSLHHAHKCLLTQRLYWSNYRSELISHRLHQQ
jgi:hypothetical protein